MSTDHPSPTEAHWSAAIERLDAVTSRAEEGLNAAEMQAHLRSVLDRPMVSAVRDIVETGEREFAAVWNGVLRKRLKK